MKTKNKILVALDLEEQAMIALQYAEYFAEMLDYELEVLTVVEESNIFSKLFSSKEVLDKLNQEVKEKIDNAVVPFKNKVRINTTIEYGKPYEKIVEFAEKIEPCFIFMGKSEMPRYKRAFLGSNSMHVILESDYPVITIRGDYDFEKYKKQHREILVPIDLEKDYSEQLSAAVEFAQMLKTSLCLYAIERQGSKGMHTKMMTQLAQAKKMVVDTGIGCSTELIENTEEEVYKLICREAEKRNAAMIVIMTREESKFTGLFLGSNARDIINNSAIPVLSVEPWDHNAGSKVFSQYIDILNVFKK